MKATRPTQYKIMSIDPWLQPYYKDIALRMDRHANTRKQLLGDKPDLSSFANGAERPVHQRGLFAAQTPGNRRTKGDGTCG